MCFSKVINNDNGGKQFIGIHRNPESFDPETCRNFGVALRPTKYAMTLLISEKPVNGRKSSYNLHWPH